MTMEELVKNTKRYLEKLSIEEFESMLERNGINEIKSEENSIFYQAVVDEVHDSYVNKIFEFDVNFEQLDEENRSEAA